MTKLLYIADPMCSWCYGFGPELTTLLDGVPEIKLEIIVGGLRAYNRDVLDEQTKTTLISHWQKVEEASGLPFSKEALSRDGFIYDTEPACRAVVTVKTLAPQAAFDVFRALQQGFYAEGIDVTQEDVLANISVPALKRAGVDISAAEFIEAWSSEAMIAATKSDFLQTQHWGLSGFPTLVLEHANKLSLVTDGFVRTEALVERLQALVDQAS